MIILDIETSGISPYKNGMLSLGAVDFNTKEEFYGECKLTEGREITPIALEINGFTVEQVNDPNKQSDVELYLAFCLWAQKREPLLAGHNIGHFDILFLEEIHTRLPFEGEKFPFPYRTIDLHSVFYALYKESLSHDKICDRLGLPCEPKPHNALGGAKSEAEAFHTLFS
jgi:DNA polymerase III epsilon subunit-like protein